MDKAKRMEEIFDEMLGTYKAKNADYGDSFSKSYKEFGLIAPVVRMSDKLERLKTLSKADPQVKDESKRDTLIDLANYAIMTVIEMDIETNDKVGGQISKNDVESAVPDRVSFTVKSNIPEKMTKEDVMRAISEELDRINGINDYDQGDKLNI